MNTRSRASGICTGDQAIFVRRADFEAVGGYPEIPLMEDIELSRAAEAPRADARAPPARHHLRAEVGAGGPAAHDRPHVGPPLPALLRGGPRAAAPLVLLRSQEVGRCASPVSGCRSSPRSRTARSTYAGYERLLDHYVRAGVTGRHPARDHRREPDHRRGGGRGAGRAHRGHRRGPGADPGRRRRQRHPEGREGGEAAAEARGAGHPLGLPLLQPAEPGRHARALHPGGRGHRPADPDLQHPLSHRRESHQRDPARAGRLSPTSRG